MNNKLNPSDLNTTILSLQYYKKKICIKSALICINLMLECFYYSLNLLQIAPLEGTGIIFLDFDANWH